MSKVVKTSAYVKGLSGKSCPHSDEGIAYNATSGNMHTFTLCNPYTGDPTEAQTTQREVFKSRAEAVRQWLDDNRAKYYSATDTEVTSGKKTVKDIKTPATALYSEARLIQKREHMSSITSALYLYQSTKSPYAITLPSEGGVKHGGSSSSDNL